MHFANSYISALLRLYVCHCACIIKPIPVNRLFTGFRDGFLYITMARAYLLVCFLRLCFFKIVHHLTDQIDGTIDAKQCGIDGEIVGICAAPFTA